MNKRKKVLFLYTELASYFLACVKELSKDMDVAIVRWEVNPEAPFVFDFDPEWKIYERNEYISKELIELSQEFDPDLIVCSGWIDEGYNSVAKHWMGKVPTVLSLDNHYTGSLRQRVGRLLSKFKLHNRFSHVWVPGDPQRKFAKKLGFKENAIYDGFYSADTLHFDRVFQSTFPLKEQDFPKRFLYVGRYLEFKGIHSLWSAFIEANKDRDEEDKWELWCVGTGDLWEERVQADGIKHFGFLQAKEMEEVIRNSGVFILPSYKEPWGVVIHEMAMSGFPILSSSSVGASSAFLIENENGYYFDPKDDASIQAAMEKMMDATDEELLAMAKKSHELGNTINPVYWKGQIESILS